jgi:hypothetical protein
LEPAGGYLGFLEFVKSAISTARSSSSSKADGDGGTGRGNGSPVSVLDCLKYPKNPNCKDFAERRGWRNWKRGAVQAREGKVLRST